jgi:hypothetical protein
MNASKFGEVIERSVSFGLKASHGLLFSLSLMTPSMNTSFLFFLVSTII